MATASATGIPGVQAVLAVSSGKGGVGKSTVAANLACALAQKGLKVGLIDADIYGPNIPTMMGVTDEPVIAPVDGKGEMLIPPTAQGVKIISMAMLVPEEQPMIWRGPMLHSTVQQFLYKVDWGQLDALIVDMPPGTGDIQLSLAQLVPMTGAILVTTPQEVAVQDVRKAYRMFEQVRVPVLGFVENMSYFKCDGCEKQHFLFGKEGGDRLSRKFGAPVLARLPMVPSVRQGGDEGYPAVVSDPQGEVAQQIQALAAKVQARLQEGSAPSPEISLNF
jgi:ATP-binding protein involved in chromosome partitioning